MDTRLVAIVNGRRFYEVVLDARPLFTGTLAECERFRRLHEEKETDAARVKRQRDHPQARVYRIWAGHAAAGAL